MGIAAIVLVGGAAGWALLALSQDRHWQSVTGTSSCGSCRPWLRAAGALLLLSGLPLALRSAGPGFGSVIWLAALSITAFAIVAVLAWRPRWLRPLAFHRPLAG